LKYIFRGGTDFWNVL